MGMRVFAPLWFLFAASVTANASLAAEAVAPRPGVQQLFLFAEAPNPTASVILLAGGNGRLGLTKLTDTDTKNRNFLVRSRALFVEQGLNVATVDVPSDRRTQEGLRNFRPTVDHARDLDAAAAFLRRKADVPVFLVGTSTGPISAANAAVRQVPGTYTGVVLTSPVTSGGRQEPASLKDVDIASLQLPVLVVYHKDDRCGVSRPAAVPGLVKDLTGAPSVKQIEVQGGLPAESDPCEGLVPHGYYGKERETVEAITRWIRATLK